MTHISQLQNNYFCKFLKVLSSSEFGLLKLFYFENVTTIFLESLGIFETMTTSIFFCF